MFKIPRKRLLIGILAALAVAIAGSAFTASNTVAAHKSGLGATTVSGYTITNIQDVLNATDPSKIDAITATLDSAASVVKVQDGGTWYSCTNTTGNDWSCDTTVGTQLTVAAQTAETWVATS